MSGEAQDNIDPGDMINIFDYLRVVKKRKRLIALTVGCVFSASIVVSLILPVEFASTASVLPPQKESALSPALLTQLPGGLSGGGGGLAGDILGVKSPADIWIGILNSQTVRDAIINRFNLRQIYNARTIEEARDSLGKKASIEKAKSEIISIRVEDRDPKKAALMANAFVEELDRVNRGLVMTSGKRTRIFLGERLKEAKGELSKAEGELNVFQNRNKAVKLDDQSKAVIEAIATLKGQLISKEVQLQTLLTYATPAHPSAEILKSEISGLSEKLGELEEGRGLKGGEGIFIPTSKYPDMVLNYARLLRNVKVQETVCELLTQQYEMAKIQEVKDSPTVQVLDTARVPEKKSKPKRLMIVILSTFASFFFAVFAAFFLEYVEKLENTIV